MSCTMRNIVLLSSRISSLSLQSVRFYPRWSHRTPLRIIEAEPKREPKASWRLEAEKEIVRKSTANQSSSVVELHDRKDEKVDSGKSSTRSDTELSVVGASDFVGNKRTRGSVDRNFDYENFVYNRDNFDAPSGKSERTKAKAFEIGKEGTFTKPVDTSDLTRSKRAKKAHHKSRGKGQNADFLDERNAEAEDHSDESEEEGAQVFPKGKKRVAIEAKELKMMESAAKLGVPLFKKLGNDDTVLSKYVLNSKSEKVRKKTRLILMEGRRLIEDALAAGVAFRALFFSRVKDIQSLPLPEKGLELYKVTLSSMSRWSDLSTCPGIMGFAEIPNIEKKRPASLPLTIICDNIRDPGNLGAVLRTSAAVGCECVVLTKGCVDLWNPKVIRAAAGAHFRLKIYADAEWGDVYESVDENANVFVADNDSYEVTICDEEEKDRSGEDGHAGFQSSETVSKVNEIKNLPLVPYFAFNFTHASSLVLIVGGETEGISEDAYNFMHENHGVRLNVPLSNNIESLNTGTALGIIAFEMKKQFLVKESSGSRKQSTESSDAALSRSLQSNG